MKLSKLGIAISLSLSTTLASWQCGIANAQPTGTGKPAAESAANSLAFPRQILKTGVSLNALAMSSNSLQLADTVGLTPILERIRNLRTNVEGFGETQSLESLAARQSLWEARQKAALIIQRTDLDIDFAIAEIEAEHQLYEEILATFTSDRDKKLAVVNATSFISNGVLWALAEGFDIPSYKVAKWSIPSGTAGIAAGVIPSLASMYTLKAINGKKVTSEAEPNMLAKLFGYPTTADTEYPRSVWQFLNQVPADDPKAKKRLDQLVDRWIADANMPGFTDRHSKKQLDVLTASVSQRKGLSIATLSARTTMLQQLHAEIWKMKRLLLEITMTVEGEKQFSAS